MKQTVLMVVVACLTLEQVMAALEPVSEGLANMRYSIAACVLSATEEFHREDIVTVALTTLDSTNYTKSAIVMDQLLLRTLHEEIKWTLLVTKSNRPEKRPRFFKKSDEYIIQMRDDIEFDKILRALMMKSSWNPYGKFIVLSTTVFPDPATIVQHIFERFWKERVLNAVLMLPNGRDSSRVDLYSWFPCYDADESTTYQSPQNCFQNLLSILLGITVKTLPKIVKTRFLIYIWIVVSLHLNSAFTSSLIRELTQPSFEKSNQSIEYLIEQGYKIGLVSPTDRFLVNSSKLQGANSRSIVHCFDVIKCLDRTAYKRNFAVGLPRMYMQYASNRYITAKGQQMLHWMDKDIASYPFLAKINRTLMLQSAETNDVILTIRHLEGAFCLLFLGLVLAGAVFVFEMFLCRKGKI
ncbi:hypothetical protein CBL_20717 [Carabus blaptoides fortunei]